MTKSHVSVRASISVLLVGLLAYAALPVHETGPGSGRGALPPILKNCTTMIVGKEASAEGSVMLARHAISTARGMVGKDDGRFDP